MKHFAGMALALSFMLVGEQSAEAQGFMVPVSNPFAEDGPAAADSTVVVPVPGWVTSGGFTVVAYGTPGPFPTVDPGGPDNNLKFFTGGPDSAFSTATQLLTIPAEILPAISIGGYYLMGTADMGGWATSIASPGIRLTLMDGGMNDLCATMLGPIAPDDRRQQTGFVSVSANCAITVPPESRFVRMTIEMSGSEGSYNTGFVDNIYVNLVYPDPVQPATWSQIKTRFSTPE